MKAIVTTILCMSMLLLLAACAVTSTGLADSGTETSGASLTQSDADAIALAVLADKAVVRARETATDAVLRKVNVNPKDGSQIFQFTDVAATTVISVTVSGEDSPPDQWQVNVGISPLVGLTRPEMRIDALRFGPGFVAETATRYWEGCGIRSLGLTGEGSELVWYVFCDLPQGVVSGLVDGRTGAFTPSGAPPARPPQVATPEPPKKR
jgi:hypothetical protein